MGNDADDMADAAVVLAEAGADVIDLNMGCPTKQASKNGVGAAMLKDPALVFRVVSAIRAVVSCPVSVKMRAGFDDATHVLTRARAIEDAGADFLAVHPRLRRDQYTGVADWRVIARIKDAVRIPVIGNGDCWYAADALRMRRETGCDAVMIGRPAIRNPWIFEQIAALDAGREPIRPSGEDLTKHLEETARSYVEHYRGRAIGPMKELTRYCARVAADGNDTVRALMRCQTLDELLVEARRRLAPLPAEALDLGPEGTLESSGYCRAEEQAA
jgi:nifR3 family TIM-barrel protein